MACHAAKAPESRRKANWLQSPIQGIERFALAVLHGGYSAKETSSWALQDLFFSRLSATVLNSCQFRACRHTSIGRFVRNGKNSVPRHFFQCPVCRPRYAPHF